MKYLKYLPIAALFSAVAFAATADEKAASASAEPGW
jgi:hypothetical protein